MANGSGMLIRQYAYDQSRKNPGVEVKILSERELCRIYNVSRPTVRKSLDELVDEKILIIRKGQGTFTNPGAFKESYLPGNKLSVGIIVGTGKNVIYDRFFWGIISEVCKVICDGFGDVRLFQAVNDNEKTAEEFLLLNLDGLIWIHPTEERVQAIEMIQKGGLPVICVNRIPPGENINYVSTDFYAAGQNIAEYLLNKKHRKILFIADTSIEAHKELYCGYCDVFSKRKLDFDGHLAIVRTDEIIADISNLFRFKIEFTACFAFGSHIWTAIEAFKKTYGEKFREKYELVTTYSSCDKFLDCPFININPYELGRIAALELEKLAMKKQEAPIRIKLKPDIIEGTK
ncbi:MAG: hypothetical protein A2017_02555 [Lentisphaerae bacterium GWF2_44_16]|nr:MAG: hypothetical protein A2017_02555 [Lentisphaerae bacterium GWF2_44_16]